MTQQITSHNNSKQTGDLVRVDNSCPDSLTWWAEQYFKYEVTTVSSSQRAQQQDLTRFIMYMLKEEGNDERHEHKPYRL
jgi:hypothetical protein